MYNRTIFRLKTAVTLVGITEPQILTPQIAEPIQWSNVPFRMVRDKKYHGFSPTYSEGDLKLIFQCNSAHELINSQYRQYGTDAIVEFLVIEVDDDGTETIDYRGKIDFETFEIEAGQVSASVTENTIYHKINDRFESPVALDLKQTLDNEPIIAPTSIELPLPGQTITESGDISRTDRIWKTYEDTTTSTGGLYTLLPNLIWPPEKTPVPPETLNLQQMEGVAQLTGDFIPGDHQNFPIITTKYAEQYHIEVDWLTKINIAMARNYAVLEFGKVKFASWAIQPLLIVQQPGKDAQEIGLAPKQSGSGEKEILGERSFTVRYQTDLDLPAGSKVYVFFKIAAFSTKNIKHMSFSADTRLLHINIKRKTKAEASKTTAYLLPDALRFVTGAISGAMNDDTGTGAVEGSLIDYSNVNNPFDGYATEYAVASGGQLRGLKKAPTFTFKELIDTLWSQHAAGILYQRNETTGRESVRIEQGDWFYRGGKVLEIDTVFEYNEQPDLDLLFNQIEVGYNKFPDSGPGVAEEFNTTRTYQTPLVSRDAKLEIVCPLIAAGTAIEEARRLGLTKTDENGKVIPSTDAGSYDDDNFLLHVGTQTYTDTVQFFIKPPQPFPGKPYTAYYVQFSTSIINKLLNGISLKYGDIIVFSGTGTAMDGVPMFVGNLVKSGSIFKLLNALLRPTYEIILPTTFVETANPIVVNWRLGNQPAKLRTDERLIVTGLSDPGSTANLELTPARMLRRHALFINSGLFYKQAIDELKCTAYKHNGQLTTKARPEINPLPGDPDKQIVRESGNISLGTLGRFDKLFEPNLITAKVQLTREEVKLIRAAHQNKALDESINMGYLSILNPDGEFVDAVLLDLSYNKSSEVADLVLRKVATDRNPNGPDCTDYTDWTFNRFETDQTANPNLYRFCRFSDFA